MKKVFIASLLSACVATTVHAESPLNDGEIGLVINPIGETSVGLRLAMTDTVAAYGLVRVFDRLTDEDEVYSSSSDSLEDYGTKKDPGLSLAAGLQYFVSGGLYLLGEVGYYNSDDSYEFDDGSRREDTFKGLDWSFGAGFEHGITERLSVHTSAELEFGGREITDSGYASSGDQVDGTRTDRSYSGIQYRLGFSYALN